MNPWLVHVDRYRQQHPDKTYKQCLENCKKTYKTPVVRQSGGFLGIDSSNLYPGELHGVLKLPDGGYKRANYLGPRTALAKRIDKGDKGVTEVDKAAKAHDLRYAVSKDKAAEQFADRKFNFVVDKIQQNGTDHPINIAQAKLVKVKDALGIPATLFTKIGTASEPGVQRTKYLKELDSLKKKGYGYRY